MVDVLGNPFGNSTLSATQDQRNFVLNVLELLEGTVIDWKSLDSRNVEIFS